MNLFKSLVLSFVLFSATTLAHAQDYNLGSLTSSYTQFGPNTVSGSFLDRIFFTLDAQSAAAFGTNSLDVTLAGTDYFSITNFSQSLYNSSNQLVASGLNFSLPSLSSGVYHLQISGNGNGLGGGIYAGAIGIVASPVPEPTTLTSMLFGLTLFGFLAFRRRNQ